MSKESGEFSDDSVVKTLNNVSRELEKHPRTSRAGCLATTAGVGVVLFLLATKDFWEKATPRLIEPTRTVEVNHHLSPEIQNYTRFTVLNFSGYDVKGTNVNQGLGYFVDSYGRSVYLDIIITDEGVQYERDPQSFLQIHPELNQIPYEPLPSGSVSMKPVFNVPSVPDTYGSYAKATKKAFLGDINSYFNSRLYATFQWIKTGVPATQEEVDGYFKSLNNGELPLIVELGIPEN